MKASQTKKNALEEVYNQLFTELDIFPLTIKQNTPEWFLLRTFSFTSSTSDYLLAEAKKIALDDELNSFIDEAARGALTVVLTMIW